MSSNNNFSPQRVLRKNVGGRGVDTKNSSKGKNEEIQSLESIESLKTYKMYKTSMNRLHLVFHEVSNKCILRGRSKITDP